ncbi:ribonuclease H [Deinococcus sp.]|uniref:ribonuclease H n=1 Tax=Deinococcus sp. TaxID=47478 RepID=UPI0025C1B3E7|nr:ribonuclease H [Deinococcus sp.]
MNHAFVDASWQEQVSGPDLGGWGAVLLLPGELPRWLQGPLSTPDNNAAELQAVLETVRAAPANEALTVWTDNQTVIGLLARGRGPDLLSHLTHEVHNLAQQRGIALNARSTPRTGRHMLTAHQLANEARRGERPRDPVAAPTELLIDHRSPLAQARISLRRRGSSEQLETVTREVRTDPNSDIPPSVQVLLAALQLAQPGESLMIRRASRIAQALWHRPERALRPAVNATLIEARQRASGQGLEILFLGTD